jgi:acetyl-CoA synthetase (ADP-forming)
MGKEFARKTIEKVRSEGRRFLTELESKDILRVYGIPTTQEKLAKTPEEAASVAGKMGFPIALKISSPDITHKTDVGGVRLGLKTAEEVKKGFSEIVEDVRRHLRNAKIQGVLVQNMVPLGHEVIVGVTKDPQFGPVLMFGLGGIFVEVLKDVSFHLIPATKEDAMDMVKEIKGFPVLQGYRNLKPADLDALTEIMVKASEVVMDLPEIDEMDLNPIFVHEEGAVAVDARMILSEKKNEIQSSTVN